MSVSDLTYTLLCPFGGIGAGALGFLQARVDNLLGRSASFRLLGGIDLDSDACKDFVYLTGAQSLCADVAAMTPEQLRGFAGKAAPDVVFLSPPCKGSSGLLSESKAKTPKYVALNRLTLDWMELMLATWPDEPPRLVLLENVPRITTRAASLLKKVRSMLHAAGYVSHATSHDCGELGGLAQHRRRFLLVARHQKRVPPLLYQPVKQRVRACGTVLEQLPMPGDPRGGAMHALPKLSWLNWVRLALIPAGGDWRDLPGVLEKHQKRREKFKRHAVERWDQPTGTVGGSGSNGVENVADPRPGFAGRMGVVDWNAPVPTVAGESYPSNGSMSVADPRVIAGFVPGEEVTWHKGKYAVTPWDRPSRTVIGGPSNGAGAVADPRVVGLPPNERRHWNKYAVEDWEEPARTVMGATRPGSGAPSVADPRVTLKKAFGNVLRVTPWKEPTGTITSSPSPSSGAGCVADPRAEGYYNGVLGVIPWDEPTGVVTGRSMPSTGNFAVADPRVKNAFDHGYGVLAWDEASPTVAGGSHPGQGAYSVADPRVQCTPRAGAWGVIPWHEAAKTVSGHARIDNGCFAVADPRIPDAPPVMVIRDVRKAPPHAPVILAEDGTWHRPLTTLELAALQSIPTTVRGKPLKLAGASVSRWRERIGNAVPCAAGKAIAERMLVNLMGADLEAFALSTGGDVWVKPGHDPAELAELLARTGRDA